MATCPKCSSKRINTKTHKPKPGVISIAILKYDLICSMCGYSEVTHNVDNKGKPTFRKES